MSAKEKRIESQDYNTKTGIAAQLTSLEGLHAVIEARYQAGYGRRERLRSFVVMGRWHLDTCGNCCIARNDGRSLVPKERFPEIPDVLEEVDFWSYIKQRAPESRLVWVVAGGTAVIARPHIPCAACGKTWTLANCHDCEGYSDHQDFSLTEFVGQAFGQFRASLRQRMDGVYIVQPEMEIRNDRFIDLTPDPAFPRLKKNEHGWVGCHGEITDAYVIQPGDETLLVRTRYYHPACYAADLAAETKQKFLVAFVAAGFAPETLVMTEVANRYGSASYRGPWYQVQTPVGTITIGWRKRVVNLDWSGTGRNLQHLFDDQDVTKDPFSIHAWSLKDVAEYLRRIRTALADERVLVPA